MPDTMQGGFLRDATGALVVVGKAGATIVQKPRAQILTEAQGFITENFPSGASIASQLLVTQTIYLSALGLRAADVITNIHVRVGTGGTAAGSTLTKVGLYDLTGNLLRKTADLGSSWESVGLKTHALTSTYTMPADGGVWVALVASNSTTLPSLSRGSNSARITDALTSKFASANTGGTGQTDLGATITVASGTPFCFWVGVS